MEGIPIVDTICLSWPLLGKERQKTSLTGKSFANSRNYIVYPQWHIFSLLGRIEKGHLVRRVPIRP